MVLRIQKFTNIFWHHVNDDDNAIFQNVPKVTDLIDYNVARPMLVKNYCGSLYSYFSKLTFDNLDFNLGGI